MAATSPDAEDLAIARASSDRSARPGAPARWLVLAYIAADSDLEAPLVQELAELERVGSRPSVLEILAQVDRRPGDRRARGRWCGSRRYHVLRRTEPGRPVSRLLEDLGASSAGDPRVLADFVRVGVEHVPADAHVLIVVNHASGAPVAPRIVSRGGTRPGDRTHASPSTESGTIRRRSGALFRVREPWAGPRARVPGIASEWGAEECLDTLELARVLRRARHRLRRPIDLLGLDGCLMPMLEIAWELRYDACILVGSEEVEPLAGWPHPAIWQHLLTEPTMDAGELGRSIVRHHVDAYRGSGQPVTQSALALGALEPLVDAVDALAGALLASLGTGHGRALLTWVRERTLDFLEGTSVDLHHLATELGQVTADPAIRRACARIAAGILGREAPSPILAAAHDGVGLGQARGLSICFPRSGGTSRRYRDLAFSRRTRWAELLDAFSAHGG